jgi:alternate signal-mediated exported protein
MNKTIKGAFAASTAAVLLMGGAGSLAYWSDAETVGGSTITAGNLDLDATACNTAGWVVNNTIEKVVDQPFAATDKVVPGDVLTKTCTITVTAVGKNLRATLGATPPVATGSTMPADSFTLTSSFTRNNQPLTSVTSADVNKDIKAVITVAFPIKNVVDNNSKLTNVTLSAVTVTATQATTPAA